jgi:hypothetical protein
MVVCFSRIERAEKLRPIGMRRDRGSAQGVAAVGAKGGVLAGI